MNILWMTWKDGEHPEAGGAEVVNEELAKRLVGDGHEVTFLVAGFGAGGETTATESARDGFNIIRVGTRYTVYWRAYQYYKNHLTSWPDLVIDEVNTVPFFASRYVKQKNILFFHQLARQIWFYQMMFPLSLVGYLLEPLYLRLLAGRGTKVVTVSSSSKGDLARHGFAINRISIIGEGIELSPLPPSEFSLATAAKLETLHTAPVILALGAVRPMKRTAHVVEAFELLKVMFSGAKLVIAGETAGKYGAKVLQQIKNSPYAKDIEVLGRITKEEKIALLQTSHVLLAASVKEGWGLVVTEANSQGTPAAVYNVDGLRDSVRHEETGYVAANNTPAMLAAAAEKLLLDTETYAKIRQNAWEWSQELTFDASYKQFKDILDHA